MGVNPGAGSVDGRAFDNNTLPARQGSRPDSRSRADEPTGSDEPWKGGAGMTTTLYRSRSTKRPRRTRRDVDVIKAAILETLEADHPMTVRQLFYRLVSNGAIDKTEAEYKQTVAALDGRDAALRRDPIRLDRRQHAMDAEAPNGRKPH